MLAAFAERAWPAAMSARHDRRRRPLHPRRPPSRRRTPARIRALCSNDTRLDTADNQLLIITGPNMAGKSHHIRQVALIVIMAQMGCFVPAAEAEIGVVDRVFARVGAGDDIARGRSTFMVEMQETASILNNATPAPDRPRRDRPQHLHLSSGISIAWSVAEYLHNHAEVKAKTLFATHYHELTDIALTLSGVKNYNVLVSEKDDRIVFLRKIVPGAADKSYGIQVARLAGLPLEVVTRAKDIAASKSRNSARPASPKLAQPRARKPRIADADHLLFDS